MITVTQRPIQTPALTHRHRSAEQFPRRKSEHSLYKLAKRHTTRPNVSVRDSALPQRPSVTPKTAARVVDFLVLGSGIAGLTYALKVADFGTVAVVRSSDYELMMTYHRDMLQQ